VTAAKGWAGWLVLLVVLVAALAVGVTRANTPRTQGERIDTIAKTIKCPTCRSESVYESQSAAAENLRNEISRQVAAGRTDGEVRRYIADRFGESLLLVPSASGVGGLVWAIPAAALVLAAGGLVWAFRRWRRQSVTDGEPTDDDRALVAAALEREP
jgi:cytochrome c-type biogenesis protein CcmH